MIRGGDRARVAVRKLRTRKRWVAISIFSLSLGLTIFVTTACLMAGVRSSFECLMLAELRDLPPDQIEVRSMTRRTHPRMIRKEDLDVLRHLPGVHSVSGRLPIASARLSLKGREAPEPFSPIYGMEEPFLERYVAAGHRLREAPDRVPLIIGRDLVETIFDEKERLFRVEPSLRGAFAPGTDVDLWIGEDPPPWPFTTSFKGGRYHLERRTKAELDEEIKARRRPSETHVDRAILGKTLRLSAHIVGLGGGAASMIPIAIARDANRWLYCRDWLAGRWPPAGPGRAVSKEIEDEQLLEREISMLWLQLERPEDERSVYSRVRGMGFEVTSRRSRIEAEVTNMGSATDFAQTTCYGIGLIVFLLACLFVATTTSKIIGDSRREIGVFRAVGATRQDILSIFLLQAGLLGLTGALLGILQGIGCAEALSAWALSFTARQMHAQMGNVLVQARDLLPRSIVAIDGRTMTQAALAAVVVSVLAGLIPARRASHIDPVEALRRVE